MSYPHTTTVSPADEAAARRPFPEEQPAVDSAVTVPADTSPEKSNFEEPRLAATPPPPPPPGDGQVLPALLFGMLGGAMFGAGLGFISFYFVYNTIGATCVDFTGQVGCETATHAGCVWTAALGAQPAWTLNGTVAVASCKYGDYESVYCPQYTTQDACGAIASCVYSFSSNKCKHAAGFKSWESGLFSASYFFGTTVGPLTVNHVLSVLKFRPAAAMYASLAIVGAIFVHIGRAVDAYPMLLIGFAFFGCSATGVRLCANLFGFAAVSSPATAGRLTGVLQPTTELVQLLVAIYVFALRPGDDRSGDQRVDSIIHGQLGLWHVLGVLGLLVAAFVIKEVDVVHPDGTAAKGAVIIPPQGLFAPLIHEKKRLAVGLTCGMALLMTGLPAIAAYTPVYSELIIGVAPTVAPLVSAGSGTAAGLCAYVLRRIITGQTRPLMLTGVAGLFFVLCFYGIVVMPGVVGDDGTREGLSIAAIALFYLFLETCVGSTFFELALSLQPPATRKGGGAVLNAALNIISLIVSFAFPNAVSGISGGPSGNQRLGWAVCLFIFAGIALFCFAVQMPFMHPYVPPPPLTTPQPAGGDEALSGEESVPSGGSMLQVQPPADGVSGAAGDQPEDGVPLAAAEEEAAHGLAGAEEGDGDADAGGEDACLRTIASTVVMVRSMDEHPTGVGSENGSFAQHE